MLLLAIVFFVSGLAFLLWAISVMIHPWIEMRKEQRSETRTIDLIDSVVTGEKE